MHTYKIYGLKVFSDFKFKGIERLGRKKESKKNADIEILNEDSGRLHTQKRSEKIKGYFPNLLEFVIYDGSKVYIDSTSGADEDEIATAILGDIMAILLRQRGLYVLHACCLSINGRAFSLVGDSGAGKSTTAYFLARNAWNLLSDDITAIDMKPGGLHVIPGPPRVKLKPEVGTQFVNDFEGKKKVHQRSEKRYVYLERSNEPSVLNKIYVLKRGKKTCIEDINPRESIVSILKNTRGSRVLTDNKHASRSLKGSEMLYSKADVKVLKIDRNIERNKQIGKVIKKDMSLK